MFSRAIVISLVETSKLIVFAFLFCFLKQFTAQFSLLFHASESDNFFGFQLLLEHGADPTWQNNCGTPVLKLLARRNQVAMAEMSFRGLTKEQKQRLVQHKSGVRLDSTKSLPTAKCHLLLLLLTGWTLLMRACEYKSVGMVKFLVENGVDINAKMKTGWNAIFTAVKKRNVEIFDYCLLYTSPSPRD